VAEVEIVARVERRRKWTIEEKAALLAEVEAEGGKVKLVARRHRVSESLLYNWRSAWKAAARAAIGASGAVAFVPLGVLDAACSEAPVALPPPEPKRPHQHGKGRAGAIEIAFEWHLCQRRCLCEREGAVARASRDAGFDMISLAPGTKVFLACSPIDLRAGFNGLAAKVQQMIGQDPFGGSLYVFRGKRGDYFKAIYWDGSGLWLLAKRLEKGRFVWPPIVDGAMTLTPAQMAVLVEAMDWRRTVAPPPPSRPMLV
jgi:transposase